MAAEMTLNMMTFHGVLEGSGGNPVLGKLGALPVFGREGVTEVTFVTVIVWLEPPPLLPPPLLMWPPPEETTGATTGAGG